jgi:hypothetical protein
MLLVPAAWFCRAGKRRVDVALAIDGVIQRLTYEFVVERRIRRVDDDAVILPGQRIGDHLKASVFLQSDRGARRGKVHQVSAPASNCVTIDCGSGTTWTRHSSRYGRLGCQY